MKYCVLLQCSKRAETNSTSLRSVHTWFDPPQAVLPLWLFAWRRDLLQVHIPPKAKLKNWRHAPIGFVFRFFLAALDFSCYCTLCRHSHKVGMLMLWPNMLCILAKSFSQNNVTICKFSILTATCMIKHPSFVRRFDQYFHQMKLPKMLLY